ncbi:hypothetical protein A7U43_26380 [Mycobacterium adipatum]|uniref:Uncharacterized protein n=1 Tax=Mycobacterium adipatum TaxID=1682113 RepID=A0A172UTQ7_9MYCO|nr:hypothetical protein [Mycobacterium adipatum]ANE82310.1 hypothetical protein A7U43_26380 [Mycobacterium adipatum]MBI5738589.1 hypothetical protein [Mycolicibacterium neoaurum]
MTKPTSAPRPALVNIAFWLVLAGSVLLLAGGLLGLSSAIGTPREAFSADLSDSEVRSIVVMRGGVSALLLITGVVLSFLAGRARNGDLRYRRSMVWLSVVLVALVFLLTLLAPFSVTPLALFGVVPVAIGATLFMRPAASDWFLDVQ